MISTNQNSLLQQQPMSQIQSSLQQQLNAGNGQSNSQMGFTPSVSQGLAQSHQQQTQWSNQNPYHTMQQQQFYQQQGMHSKYAIAFIILC